MNVVVLGVADEVEAVWDFALLVDAARKGGAGGHELGLVGVGGLVLVDVEEPFSSFHAEAAQERDGSSGLFGVRGRVSSEATVGVLAALVPPLDPLVPPRRDAGQHDYVEVVAVLGGGRLQEKNGALYAASLIPVDAAGDQNAGLALVPVLAERGEQGEPGGIVLQGSVLAHLEFLRVQSLQLCDDLLQI
eukprot:CAMPEP_0182505598 /NCGR_PEP_ID=MMETSP1321-20130603/19517_1 /TAXON_ID=91990 /ORGANISM="Bolidomonas sp., Strain RCC1657" /LENGTH=189 /DNA_ID=CAMNT_0024711163 /DNA_START=260 /DNA_END=829 /DNA_ORIENTATION=+